MKKLYRSFVLLVLAVFSCSEKLPDKGDDTGNKSVLPPGVVVNHSRKTTKVYLGTPSIAISPEGDYIVSHDESGEGTKGKPNRTIIFRSCDKGKTWTKVSAIETGQTWSNIFYEGGELYMMGTNAPIQKFQVRKSENDGNTWTEPSSAANGILLTPRFHTSAVPVVHFNGRVWRAVEEKNPNIDIWPKSYSAKIISAPEGSDLLRADSWTGSNVLPYEPTYLNSRFGGWLEGNAVPGPDGKMKIVMRVEIGSASSGEYAAIIDVSEDGKTISFNPETGFIKMPGGAKKFTIRYDETSGRYWTLSNYVKPEYKEKNPGTVRNTLALCSSEDLRTWEMHKFILEHDDVKYHAFQYVDWLVEDDDIIFVSRTSFDDRYGGAASHHDANYITFHRIEDFRQCQTEIIEY